MFWIFFGDYKLPLISPWWFNYKPFAFFTNQRDNVWINDITTLRERSPELVPDEVNAEDVVDTDSGVLTSDIGSLSDEDILAEFCEENQMEVDDGDDGNEDEQQEETPKRPTKSEVLQAIATLSQYSLFAVEGAEIWRRTT